MAFEDLTVRVSANTADANASLNRLQDGLDDVEDEASATSRSFATLSATSTSLTGSMSTLSAVTTATAVPAFAALLTAVFPLAAALGTVAAAAGSLAVVFGGLAVTGVVTHMEELKAAFKTARAEIMELIEPLGEVFGPLLVDAVDALPDLVESILDAIGPIGVFRDAMVEFGEIALDVIPEIAGAMVSLARRALPALRRFIGFVRDSGASAFDGMLRVTRELTPELMAFLGAVIDSIPALTKFGTIVLEVVLPALTTTIELLTEVTEAITDFVTESEEVETLAEWFSELNEATDGLAAKAAGIGAALGTIGVVVTGIVAKVASLSGVLGGLKVVAGAVTTAIGALSGPILAVGAAIAGLLVIASGKFDELVRIFNNLRARVDDAIGAAVTWLKGPGMDLIGQGFEALGGAIRTALINTTEWLASDGPETVIGVTETIADYLENDAASDLKEAAEIGFDAITAAVSGILDGLTGPNSDSSIQASIISIARWVRNNGPRILRQAAETAFDTFVEVTDSTIGRLIRGSSSIIQSGFREIVNWVTSIGTNDLRNAFEVLGSGIRTAVLGYFRLQESIGRVIVDFFADLARYIRSGQAWTDITNAFDTLMGGIETAIRLGFNAITPPDGVIFNAVKDIALYIASGQAYTDITNAFSTLLDGIIAVFGGLYDGLIGNSTLKDQWDNVVSWVENEAKDKVVDAFEAVASAITSALQIGLSWPEPPEIVKKAFNGNLDIDWPDSPDRGRGGSDDDDDDSNGSSDGGRGFDDDDDDSSDDGGSSTPPGMRNPPDGVTNSDPDREDDASSNPDPTGNESDHERGLIPGFSSGGLITRSGFARLHSPEMVLSQDQTAQAQREGLAVGDLDIAQDIADPVDKQTQALSTRLDRAVDLLSDVANEMEAMRAESNNSRYDSY